MHDYVANALARANTNRARNQAGAQWPGMDGAAYYGLAGDMVRTIEPHSEADPVALLLQFLTLAGNAIGRSPYYQVESDRHHTNLFPVLVGDSSKARKGTSLTRIRAVVKGADESWNDVRVKGGLSSGEGLIYEVRDPVQKWDPEEQTFEVVDPGATDKRLAIVEPEFAGVLAVAERHGNTLSPLIRRAWDGDKLQTLTKNSPLCATDAHISIVAHIMEDELRVRITRTDLANGFANRFLFALIRRSKELPFGGALTDSEILHLGERGKAAIEPAKAIGRVTMTEEARSKWAAVYSALSAAQPGLLGAVTARAEAQVVRLALIYALLDGSGRIDGPHLTAALAVWEYCEASAAHIFGRAIGDPVADEIARALEAAGDDGMTRTAIRDLFSRNRSGDRIGAALALLMTAGRARVANYDHGRAAYRDVVRGRVEVTFHGQVPRHHSAQRSRAALRQKRRKRPKGYQGRCSGGLWSYMSFRSYPASTRKRLCTVGAALPGLHRFRLLATSNRGRAPFPRAVGGVCTQARMDGARPVRLASHSD
jgi:hypothetical protein